jgi:hypothetical protein
MPYAAQPGHAVAAWGHAAPAGALAFFGQQCCQRIAQAALPFL